MSTLPLVLEPEQLEKQLGDADLLIVDLRSSANYINGHIPGAVHLHYADIVHSDPPVMGLLPDAAPLSIVLSAIGLTSASHVVAYDDEGGGFASRLLWTLDALGHPRLSLLNGGLQAWVSEGWPLDSKVISPVSSHYQARFANLAAVANKDYILSRLGQPDLVLLDTRSPAEYHGSDRRAARGGHIPGAVNMNWVLAIDEHRQLRFKPDTLLRNLLEDLGVSADKEVIVYCHTHHRSSHTYWVLKHLGYPKVRGYPGAWSEWGNDPALPVES